MSHHCPSNQSKSFGSHLYKLRISLQSLLLLLIRGYWGYLFILAGIYKLSNLGAVANSFAGLGIPFAWPNAYFVAAAELIGGLCLLAGYRSQISSLTLSIIMIVAYATAHRPDLLAIASEPSKFVASSPFQFLLACLLVLAFGPGKASLDHWLYGSSCYKINR